MKNLAFLVLLFTMSECDKSGVPPFKYFWTLDGQTQNKTITAKKEKGKQVILSLNSSSLCPSHAVIAVLRLDNQLIDSIEITEAPLNRNIVIDAGLSGDLEVTVTLKELHNGINCVWFGEVKCELYEVE